MKRANEKRRRPNRTRRAEPDRLRKIDLARQLGISRVSVDKYLNRDGAPSPDKHFRYSVEEVAAFIAKQKNEDSKVKGAAHWSAELSRLKCEQLAEQIARERGDFIEKNEAKKVIVPLMTELGEMMQARFVRELPARYKGRDAAECAAMNQKACDDVAERFRRGMAAVVA